jgi:hypothetical protein
MVSSTSKGLLRLALYQNTVVVTTYAGRHLPLGVDEHVMPLRFKTFDMHPSM